MSELKAWKQLSSRYIHREKWFALRADQVQKGNGDRMYPYYVLEYSDWVNVFPLTSDGRVVLVKQYRYGLGTFSLELPGGIMDPHETHPEDAARRELLEETGFSCGNIEQVGVVATNPATSNNRLFCFLARDCAFVQPVAHDENEEIEVVLLSLDELAEKLRRNEIIQSLHVSSMVYALLRLGKLQF